MYGVSALLLFPVLAWQTKLLLDAEPDAQRRIALSALGSPVRELLAGLAAAAVAALPLILLSVLLPWLFDATTGALKPFAGLGSWAAFTPAPHGAMMMGDTVVFEDEVTPAIDAANAIDPRIQALERPFGNAMAGASIILRRSDHN